MIVAALGAPRGCAAAALGELEAAAAAGKARLRGELAEAAIVCVIGELDGAQMAALRAVAEAGTAVLGVCEGVKVLVEMGLVDVGVEKRGEGTGGGERGEGTGKGFVEGRATAFTRAIPAGRMLQLGEAHLGLVVGEQVESEGRVVLRACGAHGESREPLAVCGAAGNVVAIAAHLSVDLTRPCGADGRSLLLAALAWKRGTPARIDLGR